ncbi:hypothetical protein HF086_004975 [Spodoptera exigua]|uniref:NFX1-type zinc finger-containing protein 1 n=1 Tax=Spodoptera exigua TaxID=7107 RepID=A0A922M2S7_SPOEX|nr:hypothetical protein HF086_004975 [Spodoptera exigua]
MKRDHSSNRLRLQHHDLQQEPDLRTFVKKDRLRDNNPRSGRATQKKRTMGFIGLQKIAESEEKDVLQKINEHREDFFCIVNAPIEKHDVFVLVVEILSKATQSPFVELKSKLMLDVFNTVFINHLRYYLVDLPYDENKSSNNLYWRNQIQFWKNLLTFCNDIVDTSPAIAINRCKGLIAVMKTCLESLHDNHGLVLSEDCTIKFNEIRQKMTSYENRYQSALTGKKEENTCQDLQPPDDFRNLSLVPTVEDLFGSHPFLRPNIVEGRYEDVKHYLDVQFRLLREDCFGPVRDGINQYLADPNKTKYDHIRLFHNTRFLCPYVDNLRVGSLIQMDMKRYKHLRKINWKNSKRFLFGSLVLFTKDNFNTFLAATILHRDADLLSSGKLAVSIVDVNLDDSVYNGEMYTMIESEVYFECYYHVMKSLQECSFPQHLPMQKYIVEVSPGLNPPAYLTLNTKFVIPNEEISPVSRSNENNIEIVTNEESDKQITKKTFDVLQPNTWPTMEELNLNESQYEAYRLALTQEFAVIQGPPGTGKTFIGLKVAKTLLNNIQADGQCLMLVICYTNHALDQFLEAISHVTKSLVRIGGQSRNKAIDQFNLATLRRTSFSPSAFPSHKYFIEQRNQVRRSMIELQSALKTVDVMNNGLLSYNYLLGDIPALQVLDAYYKGQGMELEDPLEFWLFEPVLTFNPDYYRNLEDCLLDYKTSVDTEEELDNRRERLDFDDENLDSDLCEQEEASFLLSNAKSKIKNLVSNYYSTQDVYERNLIVNTILNLDARINLFNAALSPALAAYEEARMMMDVQLLKTRRIKVVGMTTSGGARMRKLLKTIAPKIVIVEEAAEVLEQHIITSLTKYCQHLILIGDHQQLRPSASHVKLAKRYNIEVSLFERMITNGMHSRRLNVQHRMRPEIAALISPHIYKDLANHPSVSNEGNSRENRKEGDMALALANYLMNQGFSSEDITILAAYSGQKFYMKKVFISFST